MRSILYYIREFGPVFVGTASVIVTLIAGLMSYRRQLNAAAGYQSEVEAIASAVQAVTPVPVKREKKNAKSYDA
ncbi:MAG: hypothetical protein WAQ99_13580 [Pyrinomonadaceae bacterium]